MYAEKVCGRLQPVTVTGVSTAVAKLHNFPGHDGHTVTIVTRRCGHGVYTTSVVCECGERSVRNPCHCYGARAVHSDMDVVLTSNCPLRETAV